MKQITDFHSHLLPGVDDGSRNVEMSLAMLQMEAEQGVDTVVLTPHFYAHRDTPDAFLERRKAAEDTLRQAAGALPQCPRMVVGAEVAYFRGMSESEELKKLCIDDTDYILIELPAPPWKDHVYAELRGIVEKQKLMPVIAHIDRYLPLFGANRVIERLTKLPLMLQANAHFFISRRTARTAMRLLAEEKIHLLGSDCHNLDSRAPNLKKAADYIEKCGGKRLISQIGQNQMEILGKYSCTNG